MDSRRASGVALFGVVILALIWGLLSLLPQEAIQREETNDLSASVVASSSARVVKVYHSANKESHTYTGTIDLPTPCHTLATATSIAYSSPTKVTVALTVNPPMGVCTQVVTEQTFSTTVSSESVPDFLVSIDGENARVVLLEK